MPLRAVSVFIMIILLISQSEVVGARQPPPAANPSDFATTTTCGTVELPLRGTGAYRFLAWDVFYVGLYTVEEETGVEELIAATQPFVVEIHYNWTVERKELLSRMKNAFESNKSINHSIIAEDLATFYSTCRRVRKGDVARAEFDPDHGMKILFNGSDLDSIEGKEFASAFLSLWISKHSIQQQLSKSIMER